MVGVVGSDRAGIVDSDVSSLVAVVSILVCIIDEI